jgi:hypothetical protein
MVCTFIRISAMARTSLKTQMEQTSSIFAEARHEATLAARELLAEHIRNGSTPGSGQYEITDEAGRVVVSVTIDRAPSGD